MPLGVEDLTVPEIRTLEVPEASLIVLNSNCVTEDHREPLNGANELRDAAMFAYNVQSRRAADVIEKKMHLIY